MIRRLATLQLLGLLLLVPAGLAQDEPPQAQPAEPAPASPPPESAEPAEPDADPQPADPVNDDGSQQSQIPVAATPTPRSTFAAKDGRWTGGHIALTLEAPFRLADVRYAGTAVVRVLTIDNATAPSASTWETWLNIQSPETVVDVSDTPEASLRVTVHRSTAVTVALAPTMLIETSSPSAVVARSEGVMLVLTNTAGAFARPRSDGTVVATLPPSGVVQMRLSAGAGPVQDAAAQALIGGHLGAEVTYGATPAAAPVAVANYNGTTAVATTVAGSAVVVVTTPVAVPRAVLVRLPPAAADAGTFQVLVDGAPIPAAPDLAAVTTPGAQPSPAYFRVADPEGDRLAVLLTGGGTQTIQVQSLMLGPVFDSDPRARWAVAGAVALALVMGAGLVVRPRE